MTTIDGGGMRNHRGACGTLDRAGYVLSHCSSCHEDVEYGYDLAELELPNGDYLTVCCWVAEELEDADRAAVLVALDALGAADHDHHRR